MATMYNYKAEIVRWIDGDTVDMIVDMGFKMTTEQRFRLHGIDTPERGQAGFHEAREFAAFLAPEGSVVRVHTFKDPDSFGRYLAVIMPQDGRGASVGARLLEAGLAKVYEKR